MWKNEIELGFVGLLFISVSVTVVMATDSAVVDQSVQSKMSHIPRNEWRVN